MRVFPRLGWDNPCLSPLSFAPFAQAAHVCNPGVTLLDQDFFDYACPSSSPAVKNDRMGFISVGQFLYPAKVLGKIQERNEGCSFDVVQLEFSRCSDVEKQGVFLFQEPGRQFQVKIREG